MEKKLRKNTYFRTLLKEESTNGYFIKKKAGLRKFKHIYLFQFNTKMMNKKSLYYFCINDEDIIDYILTELNNEYLYTITFFFNHCEIAPDYRISCNEISTKAIKRHIRRMRHF